MSSISKWLKGQAPEAPGSSRPSRTCCAHGARLPRGGESRATASGLYSETWAPASSGPCRAGLSPARECVLPLRLPQLCLCQRCSLLPGRQSKQGLPILGGPAHCLTVSQPSILASSHLVSLVLTYSVSHFMFPYPLHMPGALLSS